MCASPAAVLAVLVTANTGQAVSGLTKVNEALGVRAEKEPQHPLRKNVAPKTRLANEREVFVPELDARVLIRPVSIKLRRRWARRYGHYRGTTLYIDQAKYAPRIFAAGVVDPSFSVQEARRIAANHGPAFLRVYEAIESLSEVNAGE